MLVTGEQPHSFLMNICATTEFLTQSIPLYWFIEASNDSRDPILS